MTDGTDPDTPSSRGGIVFLYNEASAQRIVARVVHGTGGKATSKKEEKCVSPFAANVVRDWEGAGNAQPPFFFLLIESRSSGLMKL